MPWLPLAADLPLEGWWIVTALVILTHLAYIPIWGTTSRFEKVGAFIYPVLAFIGSIFIGASAGVTEEEFWPIYVWIMTVPTILIAGHGKELKEAEQIYKERGGSFQEHVPRHIRKRMHAQAAGALLLGAWLIITSQQGIVAA